MKRLRNTWLFMLVALLLPVAAFALYQWYANAFERLPVFGKPNHRIESFTLLNQDSEQVTLKNFEHKIIVTNFFFTRCPVVCPKMNKQVKRLQDAFKGDTAIHFLSFTVDPEHDAPVQLRNYIDHLGIDKKQWTLCTGAKKDLYALARNSFMVVATDGDGGPNDFIHSDQLVLVDKAKRIRGYYTGTNENDVNKLMNDIKKLNHENE
jgi:protein SCO1